MMSALALLLVACAVSTQAAREIIFLGDSLSDNGGGVAATDKLILQTSQTYPQDPYYMGRWSNGPVWIEFAAKTLNSRLLDFASAGGTTGAAISQLPLLPAGFGNLTVDTFLPSNNVFQQIDQLQLAVGKNLTAGPVYVVLIGTNDFLSIAQQNTSVTYTSVLKNYETAINTLYVRGARSFIFGLGPSSVSALPLFTHTTLYGSSTDKLDFVNKQLASYNDGLTKLASTFPSSHPGADVTVFDFGAALGAVLGNAKNLGLTNLQDAAYIPPFSSANTGFNSHPIGRGGGTQVANPEKYAFWDQTHPSTIVHQAIGAIFVEQLGQSVFGVPSSSSASPPVKAAAPGTKNPSSSLPTLTSPPPPVKAAPRVAPPVRGPTASG